MQDAGRVTFKYATSNKRLKFTYSETATKHKINVLIHPEDTFEPASIAPTHAFLDVNLASEDLSEISGGVGTPQLTGSGQAALETLINNEFNILLH